MSRSWRRSSYLVLLASIALVEVTGCGSDPASHHVSGRTRTVTPRPGSTIDVTVGTPFVVRLESNPTTGYGWSVQQSPPGVQLLRSNSVPPKGGEVGASGHQLLRFEATLATTGPVDLVYVRPFGPATPAKSLSFSLVATNR